MISLSRRFRASGLLTGLTLALSACADAAGPGVVRPELTAMTPDSLFGGQLRAVTVRGRGFADGLYQLLARQGGIVFSDVRVESDTVLLGNVFVASAAPLGTTSIYLVVDGAEFNQIPFRVVQPPDSDIDSILPSVARRGDTITTTIHGTNFVADSTVVSIDGAGVQLLQTTVVSSTRIDVMLAFDAAAVPGPRQLRAITYGRPSRLLPLEVTLRPVASLHLISGGGLTDSIGAPLDIIIVEARDDRGTPQPGVDVTFRGWRPVPFGTPALPFVTLAIPPFNNGPMEITPTTGANGRASVAVRLGVVPGIAWVVYSTAEIARTDSVMYTVVPGAPAKVRLSPRSGTILVDDTLRFTALLRDRADNVVPGALGTVSLDGAAATLQDGTLIRGATYGNALVRAVFGTLRDSVDLAVVPSARIAAIRNVYGTIPKAVVLRDLTGADERVVATTLGAGFGVFSPFFQAATGQIAIESGNVNYETGVLWVGDTLGNLVRQSTATPSLEYQHEPVISFDGGWLYFTGETFNVQKEVWRTRIGVDSVERITAEVGFREADYQPAPSPDGQKIAYTEWRNEAYSLRVMDLASRTISTLAMGPYSRSRWSPTGEWVSALREGGLWLIASDGSTTRQLEPSLTTFESSANWSPDGSWLIVRRAGLLELININTNVRIRLPNTGLIRDASFVTVR